MSGNSNLSQNDSFFSEWDWKYWNTKCQNDSSTAGIKFGSMEKIGKISHLVVKNRGLKLELLSIFLR